MKHRSCDAAAHCAAVVAWRAGSRPVMTLNVATGTTGVDYGCRSPPPTASCCSTGHRQCC